MATEHSEDFEAGIAPLWQRAQAGDERAYRHCLSAFARRLRGFFRWRLSACPDEVEDLVQETLLALHLRRGTHEPDLPVGPWLMAIAQYKLVDFWRRHGRREALHEPIEALDEHDAPRQDEAPTARRDIAALLATLPPAQRRAIELTKLEGHSIADAAVMLGTSEAAVKVQVHRGLRRLEARLRRGRTVCDGREDGQ
ncbi:MAG: sigma-70 family RNA polymerase sigma factor [Casimicrobiaceae bacterium]